MKKGTLLYIGGYSELAKELARDGYLVNMVSPNNLRQINEFVQHDGDDIEVARDTLESDASSLVIDLDFFAGIGDIKNKVENRLKELINNKVLHNDISEVSQDELSQEIERVLSLLPIEIIESFEKVPNIKENLGKFYMSDKFNDYIKIIIMNMNPSMVLGDEKYQLFSSYVEQMKKSADERIKDSRYASGQKRDLLDGDERWKPRLILTTNNKFAEITKGPDVNNEYLLLDVIKEVMGQKGVEVSISNIVNTRTEKANGEVIIDIEKLKAALNWADIVYDVEEKNEKITIEKFAEEAIKLFQTLDVDGGIEGHSVRTALVMKGFLEYAQSYNVTPKYRLPKSDNKEIILGALLHDNGKLLNLSQDWSWGFSPAMQTNAAPLTNAGNKARLEHAENGANNIKNIINNQNIRGNKNILVYAKDMAEEHQLFYKDVSKKPRGYSRHGVNPDTMVEVAAQYMAIVDVFDAIISGRKYNKTEFEKTLIDIRSGKKEIIEIVEEIKTGRNIGLKNILLDMNGGREIGIEEILNQLVVGNENILRSFDDVSKTYNSMTLEKTIRIMAREVGIKILREDSADRGKYNVVNSDNWSMDTNIKFELEEGYTARDTLHYNPELLKCFFEYMQSEVVNFRNYGMSTFNFAMDPQTHQTKIKNVGTRDFMTKQHRELKINAVKDMLKEIFGNTKIWNKDMHKCKTKALQH